jgi:hypothetical protein
MFKQYPITVLKHFRRVLHFLSCKTLIEFYSITTYIALKKENVLYTQSVVGGLILSLLLGLQSPRPAPKNKTHRKINSTANLLRGKISDGRQHPIFYIFREGVNMTIS